VSGHPGRPVDPPLQQLMRFDNDDDVSSRSTFIHALNAEFTIITVCLQT